MNKYKMRFIKLIKKPKLCCTQKNPKSYIAKSKVE